MYAFLIYFNWLNQSDFEPCFWITKLRSNGLNIFDEEIQNNNNN